jgi:hypothetical protein
MTNEQRWHPDLLRRFVATPYTFSKHDGANRICVESNDLEIALSVRRSSIAQLQRNRIGGLHCKLIRDMAGPVDNSEISMVSDGTLEVLCLGRGTILIHDVERSELLGFISPNVKAEDLVSSLIPALLSHKAKE